MRALAGLALALLLGLALACGKTGPPLRHPPQPRQASSAATPQPASPAPTPAPATPEPTAAPTEDTQP